MTLWILETRTGEVAEVLTCDKHSSQMPRPDGDMVQAYDCEEEVECDFCNKNDITWESKSDGIHYLRVGLDPREVF